MIRHIVMWTLKDEAEGADKASNARKVKQVLEALNGQIPGMRLLEVGIDTSRTEASADVVLYSEFDDQASLDAYQQHPAHHLAGEFVGKVRLTRQLVDYEVSGQ
ncbi:Dabb family protein [Leeia aquatica]|uniref:Dabb family protein n=1 Tax=Leeia aquatica TaxID=2725557 RepID=A0A847SCF1_9NEIS|nr:Dabb family protein [Leeia aquatica]NLR76537.1 Dabb family protein [Leeia aquatica]